jgi:4-amino-4-deoxy-L-arabinose transferase-like glycosyltransferase
VNNSCVLFKWLLIQKTIFVAQLNEGKPNLKLPIFMKITQGTLDKLEDILGESEYVVRYERGNFQSGWCLLEFKKIVVLNKFLNLEARINTLLELIPQLTIDFDKLTLDSQKLYEEVKRISLTEA